MMDEIRAALEAPLRLMKIVCQEYPQIESLELDLRPDMTDEGAELFHRVDVMINGIHHTWNVAGIKGSVERYNRGGNSERVQ